MALNQFCRPLEIIGIVIVRFQRPKQRIVFQPVFLLSAELIERKTQVLALASFKVCPRRFEQAGLEGNHSIVVNHVRRKVGLAILRVEQPV